MEARPTLSLERTAIPREFSDPRRFTRRFRTIVALAAFAAISGPIGCVAAFANRPADVVAARRPRHGAHAAVVAESYLDGRPLPFPVASGLTPAAGRQPVELPGAPPSLDPPAPEPIAHTWIIPMEAEAVTIPAGDGPDRVVETHPFLVGTGGGVLVLTVPIVETADGAPALGAVPSIEPYVPDAEAEGLPGLDWASVFETTRGSATLRERIGEWARAYAEDDRRRLLEIAGDSRNGVEYVGLGDWTVVGEPEVGGVFARGDGTSGCQVEVALASAADGEVTTRVAFDLLVADADEPLPSIVAWGPAGTALALRVYGNATTLPEQRPGSAPTSSTATTAAAAAPGEGGA
ncbi:MAG TPA: hypothetical protein VF015_07205 [Acidimicrobiales bacterium]